jgi:hypothetical protein
MCLSLKSKITVDNMKTSTRADRLDIKTPRFSRGAKVIICPFLLLIFCAPTAAIIAILRIQFLRLRR